MSEKWTRRIFMGAAATGWALRLPLGRVSASVTPQLEADAPGSVPPGFPSQDPARVRETVSVSHGNFKRVRELVDASPALAKANIDWGYGDWESALGAASHTGNRDIALYLIEKGARPTLFSAAMLGQLKVVQSFVQASPETRGILGPHGIPLLAHAKAGGESAKVVAEYLESIGGAAGRAREVVLGDAERATYVGTYIFGPAATDVLEVLDSNGSLMIRRAGLFGRRLTPVGTHTFHPAGAESVRVVFFLEDGTASRVSIHDPNPIVTAIRRR